MADKYCMEQKTKALYAIPCAFGYPEPGEKDSLFFLTFSTRDEEKAYTLAKCVCGEQGEDALVIISESGEIYHL